MADETETLILTQPENERLALEHAGGLQVYGAKDQPALHHHHDGFVVHGTAPERPLVHMVCWDADDPCHIEMNARMVLAGDEKAPIAVRMSHHFENSLPQTHAIEPMDLTMKVPSSLVNPIHHALQMRTPLQVRFCNQWAVASSYVVDINVGKRTLMSIHLKGDTSATPQACPGDEPCPPSSELLPPGNTLTR